MLPRPLPRARAVWIAVIGVPLAIAVPLDIWCDRGEPDADTLTESVRALFRTDTAAGKAAFTLTLAVGTHWLHQHILKEIA